MKRDLSLPRRSYLRDPRAQTTMRPSLRPDRPSKRPRNTRGFMSEHVALPVLLLFAGQVLGSGYLYTTGYAS